LQNSYEKHCNKLSKSSYESLEMDAMGSVGKRNIIPGIGDINFSMSIQSPTITLVFSPGVWKTLELNVMEFIGIFSDSVKQEAQNKRWEFENWKQGEIKEQVVSQFEKHMEGNKNSLQSHVNNISESILMEIDRQVEKNFGNEKFMLNKIQTIEEKMRHYILPSVFYYLPLRAMKFLKWPQGKSHDVDGYFSNEY
jgi:hypothetical protein